MALANQVDTAKRQRLDARMASGMAILLALFVAMVAVISLESAARSEGGEAPSWCNLAASQLGEDSKATCRSFGFTYDDAAAATDRQDFYNAEAPSWCNLPPSQLGPDSKDTCRGYGYRFDQAVPVTAVEATTPAIATPTSAAPAPTPTAAPTTAPSTTAPEATRVPATTDETVAASATSAPPKPVVPAVVVSPTSAPTTTPPPTTTTTAAAPVSVVPTTEVVQPVAVPVSVVVTPTSAPPAPTTVPTTAPPAPTTVPTTAPPAPTTVPTTALPAPQPAPAPAVARPTQVVVIDPGHGAIKQSDGNYAFQRPRSATGLVEDEVVLDISKRIQRVLNEAGPYDTLLTREDYRAPFAPTGCGIPCITDLTQRREWAEAQDADLLLSIHLNAFSQSSANGTETYRYSGSSSEVVDERERQLATRINSNLTALGLADRGVKANRGFSIIRSNRFPSLLIEVAFVTGSEDGERLLDPAFREQVAEAIVAAVVATP